MQRALFIGRFQPFHLGHLSVVKKLIEQYDELIIAIGSSENAQEDINPFSCHERFEMILETLKAESIDLSRIHIIPIRDIHDDDKWVAHVQELCPSFHASYSGSEYIRSLFIKANIPTFDVNKIIDIDATQIRKDITENTEWEHFVHPVVEKYLKQIDVQKLLKNIKKKGIKKDAT